MFLCVARVTLEVPAAGSVKAKRQVVRRVSDRVKAKFNVSLAEIEDHDLSDRATIALAVVGAGRKAVRDQVDKILSFIDDAYIAPITHRDIEVLSFTDEIFNETSITERSPFAVPRGERSLAEAEGMGDWDSRHGGPRPSGPLPKISSPGPRPTVSGGGAKSPLSLEEAKARARSLRNKRDWEGGS